MPLFVWLLIGGVAAYLITQGGAAAASSAAQSALPGATMTLSVQGPVSAPGPYVVPVEASLPAALQTQLATFFVGSDQQSFDPSTVATFSMQLAGQGYTIAAGSVQSAWQMIVTTLNAQQGTQPAATASSSACPPGTHPSTVMERMIEHAGPCTSDTSSSAAPPGGIPVTPVMTTAEGFTYQEEPHVPLMPVKGP